MAKQTQRSDNPEIGAADYLAAAKDHAAALPNLYLNRDYSLVIYVAGLAAECLFRAYRARRGLPFRSDHPLRPLSEEAGFPELVPLSQRERFDTALSDLIMRWHNSHRFRSNDSIRRFLKSRKLDRGIRGDFLKENARLLSSGTIEMVFLGAQQWH